MTPFGHDLVIALVAAIGAVVVAIIAARAATAGLRAAAAAAAADMQEVKESVAVVGTTIDHVQHQTDGALTKVRDANQLLLERVEGLNLKLEEARTEANRREREAGETARVTAEAARLAAEAARTIRRVIEAKSHPDETEDR